MTLLRNQFVIQKLPLHPQLLADMSDNNHLASRIPTKV